MKKHKGIKITLMISAVCIIIGSFCLGMGLVQGGSTNYLRVDKSTARWWPFEGSFGISLDGLTYIDDSDQENFTESASFSQTFADVKELELDLNAVTTTIRLGDENKLIFHNIKKSEVTIDSKKNRMSIQTKGTHNIIENHTIGNRRMEIVVKKGTILKQLDMDTNAGSVEIADLHLTDFSVDSNTADVELKNMVISRKAEFSLNAGSLKAVDVDCTNAEFDTQAGAVEYQGILRKKTEISTQAGDAEFQLKGPADHYGYTIDSNVGEVTVDKQTYSGLSNEATMRSDAKNQLQIDCQAGSVTVSFL